MHPRLRTLVVGFVAAILAVWIGYGIAQEQYLVAGCTLALCGWAGLSWLGGARAEARILAFLLIAYIVGNRGFAQFTPLRGVPLFFGELGLVASLLFLVVAHMGQRELPVRRDGLNYLLLLLIIFGSGRMAFDLRPHGVVALRDFATIYYAAFFFVAQSVATQAASRRLLVRALTVTFTLLPLTALLFVAVPDFFFRYAAVRGVPLIHYKGDLLAIFLFAGFVWLVPRGRFEWTHAWRYAFALGSLVIAFYETSRAAIMGLAATLAWFAVARHFRLLAITGAVCVAGLVGTLFYAHLQGKEFSQTRAYAVVEHLQSVVDFSGTRTYRNLDTADSGENNQYRLVWWRMLARETLADGLLLGLGFGHDLSHGFVRVYYPTLDEDFAVRSPHSILFTWFGRMGTTGLLLGLGIIGLIARETWRRAVRHRRDPTGRTGEDLALFGVCWVVLVGACFGVVLEGPMGAIPFWTILGFVHGELAPPPAPPAPAETDAGAPTEAVPAA